MPDKPPVIIGNVRLDKFVHGGQVMADDASSKKLFAWGGLPGELVRVQVTKKRKSYREGIVERVIEPSPHRIEPKEPLSYLSTSPWQIVEWGQENIAKQAILNEAFEREDIGEVDWQPFYANDQQYGYRNKIEIGFWGDDDGLHLAHYVRGTHGKQKVEENGLAKEQINTAMQAIRDELRRMDVWAGDLKTAVVRMSQNGTITAALFVKKELDLSSFKMPDGISGLDVYYSEPKSPASVATNKLQSFGDTGLVDTILSNKISYDVLSFFQVNLSVFEQALTQIKATINGFMQRNGSNDIKVVDMYSGVGTIGIAVGADVLVESDAANIEMAKHNTAGKNIEVIHAPAEKALQHIQSDQVLIVDPPRAGLHASVVGGIIEVKPRMIVYLSCNPSTQARDVALLNEHYRVTGAHGYNFFPRTPHIESLIVLELQ